MRAGLSGFFFNKELLFPQNVNDHCSITPSTAICGNVRQVGSFNHEYLIISMLYMVIIPVIRIATFFEYSRYLGNLLFPLSKCWISVLQEVSQPHTTKTDTIMLQSIRLQEFGE